MHKHHIIPRHMGGSDDPSNLIELTVEEHAEAHKKLFEEHGCWQDYLAWHGLSKMIPRDELIRQIQSEAAKERLKINGNPFTGIRTEGNFAINEDFRKHVSSLAQTDDAKAKRKQSFKNIKHQSGEKNSNFGKKWIYNQELKISKCIPKSEEIPDGWNAGRKLIW